jgi:two-component system response regulator HydG
MICEEEQMEKTNILVVDDLRNIRLTLSGIFEDRGYNVVTAEDGYQAIEAIKEMHFDVILMDIKMPGINGVDTYREVKKIDPKAVVIMMTAYSLEDLVKRAVSEGVYTCIYKPFEIDKVIVLVEDAIKEVVA